jgi:thymidylate synthase ThyX
MSPQEFENQLTPSSETFSPEESALLAPYFSNAERSVVALVNLPEVVKGALFSRYSRSAKGVRRLFLDEFFGRAEIVPNLQGLGDLEGLTHGARAKAEAFYTRVLSDYGDDSVGELGGAHIAFQEVSQIAAKTIEDHRLGLSFLEKSSRYVPFDDKVNGQYRYYRDQTLLASPHGARVVEHLDGLFETYAALLPRMMTYLEQTHPIDAIAFENALTGEVMPFAKITDAEFQRSAAFAYKQAVRAQACDLLRCLLPLATLTNVGVWGNGRALEYLLLHLLADPFAENRTLGGAGAHELANVIGPFLKRADDDKGKQQQTYLQARRATQAKLAREFLDNVARPPVTRHPSRKATLVRYDADAVNAVVGAILFSASDFPKDAVMARVQALSDAAKADIVRAYVGERKNRRHKPGRAFEHARYEFDLLINIGEFRDLQRHRVVTPDRQPYTTAHGYDTSEQIEAVPEIRAAYHAAMERADALYRALAREFPNEAQYVIPYGYRVRYNVELNLRELYHWCELRTAEQGHPDYRMTSQQMYYAARAVHPLLLEGMTFVNLNPNPPMSRLRAEMRSAKKRMSGESI